MYLYLGLKLKYMDNKYIQFISQVEQFNSVFNKPNNYTPTLFNKQQQDFTYNFLLEELNEYKQACIDKNEVEVLDALVDLMYVLCNGIMIHGMKDIYVQAFEEVQRSNLSKICVNEEQAKLTVSIRSKQQNEPCHYEKVDNHYVVYRTRDMKVMKSIGYFAPNLKQFFTKE